MCTTTWRASRTRSTPCATPSEESETTKRLAAWAAIFAVSTAMAGIWGMNFEHMPELKWAFGYPMALGAIFSAGALLYWRFRKTGWL